jgi:p-hydroxybenzoate 3-monooxygenase
MNLALFDAEAFAVAARDYVRDGDDSGLRSYSDTCLARTWRYQEYADWMSSLLFSMSGEHAVADPYGARLARARLARFADPASAAARAWGELMTGLA